MGMAKLFAAALSISLAAMLTGCTLNRYGPDPAYIEVMGQTLSESRASDADPPMPGSVSAPSRIAVCRVQRTYEYTQGRRIDKVFAVPPSWEWEQSLSSIPGGFTLFDDASTPRTLGSDEPQAVAALLDQASRLNADWLVVYSLSTNTDYHTWAGILALPTLGLLPNFFPTGDSEVGLLLVEVPTRRILGTNRLVEHCWQPANLWTTGEARQQCARRAEHHLLDSLVSSLAASRASLCGVRSPQPPSTPHWLGE